MNSPLKNAIAAMVPEFTERQRDLHQPKLARGVLPKT